MRLYLASASPRRQELLTIAGYNFKVVASDYDEDNGLLLEPLELALQHAKCKAMTAMSNGTDEGVILAADTIVVYDGRVYGKPMNTMHAKTMLSELQDKWHSVITAVAVRKNNETQTVWAETKVKMARLSTQMIADYVKTGEPLDKAGSYALQGAGALLIEKIEGCYSNVIGLPMFLTSGLLGQSGIYPFSCGR